MTAPARTADFAQKLAYYRSIHSSRGTRAMHLVGVPTVLVAMPLLVARPRIGVPLFVAGWTLNFAGHLLFEGRSPALRSGPVTYQLAGLVDWACEVGEYLARRSQRRAAA